MKTYKGFDKDLKCRGFQYEIGKEYETDTAKACESGFHACENPLDVFNYYSPADSRYCEVEQSGEIDRDTDDSKIASSKIKIGAEIGLAGIVKAGVDFILEKAKKETSDIEESSSGNGAQIGSSGNWAQIGSSGNWAQIGSSGNWALIGSSGDGAQIGSSGDEAKIGSSGENCVICCAGHDCKVKAKKGSWITLAEWGYSGEKPIPICVKTEQVDGERIKEDTFYTLKNGEFVEATDI